MVSIQIKEITNTDHKDKIAIIIRSDSNSVEKVVFITEFILERILQKFHGGSELESLSPDSYLFQTRKGNPYSRNNVYMMIKSTAKRAKTTWKSSKVMLALSLCILNDEEYFPENLEELLKKKKKLKNIPEIEKMLSDLKKAIPFMNEYNFESYEFEKEDE